jgi:hypothetical protein
MPGHACADTLEGVNRLESLRARIRTIDPFKVDIVVAALFVVAAAIELYYLDSEGHSRPVTIAAGVLCLSGLAFRRRDPVVAAVIFAVPMVLQAFLDGFLTKNSTTPFVGVLLLLWSIGRYADSRQLRIALAVLIPSLLVTLTVESEPEGIEDLFWVSLLFGLPVLAGRALRSRILLQAELREKAEQAERIAQRERQEAEAAEAAGTAGTAGSAKPGVAAFAAGGAEAGAERPEVLIGAAFAGAFLFARVLKRLVD